MMRGAKFQVLSFAPRLSGFRKKARMGAQLNSEMAWEACLGQPFATRVLTTHLMTRRVAHAYVLYGPEGVGKRTLAREMAKALNCPAGAGAARACDACWTCRAITQGMHPDCHHLVPEGASGQIRIDAVKQVLARLALRPFSATVQVVIIERAERLTEEAANSLLKTLEEPPTQTQFLLTTSARADCLPTLMSRCHGIRAYPLPREAVHRALVEQHGCDPAMAERVARLSGGSVTQAVALVDRWDAHEQLLVACAGAPSVWRHRPLPETRQDVTHWLDEMVRWLRDVAVTAITRPSPQQVVYREQWTALCDQAARVTLDQCLDTVWALIALRESLEQFVSPRLVAAVAREHWLALME